MTEKKADKTKEFKKTIELRNEGKDRQDKALTLHNYLIKIKQNFITNKFLYCATMRAVYNNETWKEMGAPSFEFYCCQTEVDVGLMPDTIKKYIRLLDKYFDAGWEEEAISGIPINKLAIVINTKKPAKWLEEAKVLGINDLKKRIAEVEQGASPDALDTAEELLREERRKAANEKEIVCPKCSHKFKI